MAGTEALLASQINGGGCLPPPTPTTTAGGMFKTFSAILEKDGDKTAYEKYNSELDPSLAFRCTTKKSMVQGVGGFIDPKNMQAMVNPADMGKVMKNGRLERVNRARNVGDTYLWMTSSERAVRYHKDAQMVVL